MFASNNFWHDGNLIFPLAPFGTRNDEPQVLHLIITFSTLRGSEVGDVVSATIRLEQDGHQTFPILPSGMQRFDPQELHFMMAVF